MIEFPNILLPEEFTSILKNDFPSNLKLTEFIRIQVRTSSSFKFLVNKLFQDIDQMGRIDPIIRSVGWHGFRDRIASAYIEHGLVREFSERSNLEHLEDIKSMEVELLDLELAGSSRIFLLGFFLKLCRIHNQTYQNREGFDLLVIPGELIQTFKHSRIRSYRPDIILISLWHIFSFLGYKEFNSIVFEKKFGIEQVIELLDSDQKSIFMSNLLTYLNAINEKDLFTEEV